MNWQPIDTAPDDAYFLVYLKTDTGGDISVAEKTIRGDIKSTEDSEPYFCRSYYCEPTHWMPLPEPPTP